MADISQSVRASAAGSLSGGELASKETPSYLVVVTFADAAQAQGLYEALVELDKQKLADLQDAIFVSGDEHGDFKINELVYNEKRKGTRRGAILGALAGLVVGGPILGLAGGSIIGRLIGKRMDLGIDSGTIESITHDLERGHSALFILGYSENRRIVVETFRKFQGRIVETTVGEEMREALQRALESEPAE
jgi:uncharacterized membrane protein